MVTTCDNMNSSHVEKWKNELRNMVIVEINSILTNGRIEDGRNECSQGDINMFVTKNTSNIDEVVKSLIDDFIHIRDDNTIICENSWVREAIEYCDELYDNLTEMRERIF